MKEPRSITLAIALLDHGDYFEARSTQADLAIGEFYIAFVHILRELMQRKDLDEAKRLLLRAFYAGITNSAQDALLDGVNARDTVVAVYSMQGGQYMALAYTASIAEGPRRSGWVVVGSLDRVVEEITKTFPEMRRYPKGDLDADDVFENWY